MFRRDSRPAPIHGHVQPGFEGVRLEFERNFHERRELGAAYAVYHRGRKVVDLWGGYLDKRRSEPWQPDTVTTVFSTTKGVAALTLALAHSRQLFEWDAPVAEYWPEFAQAGKQDISVRQLLDHQAGLCALDPRLDTATLGDFDRLAGILARQRPAWAPGTRHGYHGISLGWYQSELLRRVDPGRRSLGRFFRDEIAAPLGLEFHIGLPSEFPETRIAPIHPMSLAVLPFKVGKRNKLPPGLVLALLKPRSLASRAFRNPPLRSAADFNRVPEMRAVEIPSANGIGDARSIARLYSVFATGGSELELRKPTLDDLMREAQLPSEGVRDLVLHTDTVYSLGFMKPNPAFDFASSPRGFGTPGAGGSFGFADPDARLGVAYIMNKMGVHLVDDPREKALRDATYRAVSKIGPGA
jgi:CubicO group peptidase (beta-lactamase class C family)